MPGEDTFPPALRACLDSVYRYLLILTGRVHDAEDLTQRTFLRLHGQRARLRDKGMTAYALTVARNEFLQDRRKRGERNAAAESLALLPCAAPGPGETLDRKEEARALRDALFSLDVEQREVVQLRLYENMAWEQVAEVLGQPRTTLVSRYQAALEAMRGRLNME